MDFFTGLFIGLFCGLGIMFSYYTAVKKALGEAQAKLDAAKTVVEDIKKV